ncbi:hypothetical protein [Pseudomonas sp. 35 E 8]|uniref:hypothetical protein n=1 Tax=Pseudomonas sp. 35 E 8 TaxID=1844103 RepID=UPI0008128076|nr:hypothetical protein [Pseudomonas sp. 35 E 8]CRM62640.1 hypothetical protein [Pseudomonas sp. 35 E 8]
MKEENKAAELGALVLAMVCAADAEGNYLGYFAEGHEPEGSFITPIAPADARQKWDGQKWLEIVYTDEEMIATYRRDIQGFMDAKAQEHGYDDIKNAITYADEPAVPKFQAEGIAFRAWRSLVWAHTYDLMDKVLSGKVPAPTSQGLIDSLPRLAMP